MWRACVLALGDGLRWAGATTNDRVNWGVNCSQARSQLSVTRAEDAQGLGAGSAYALKNRLGKNPRQLMGCTRPQGKLLADPVCSLSRGRIRWRAPSPQFLSHSCAEIPPAIRRRSARRCSGWADPILVLHNGARPNPSGSPRPPTCAGRSSFPPFRQPPRSSGCVLVPAEKSPRGSSG